MSNTVRKLLEIAAAEIGYKEKKSNSQLDDPGANDGNANFTKYARDLHAAGYYQASKQGFAWCDMFVDWCFLQLCGSREVAEEMTCQTGLYGAGCDWSAKYYKDQGRFFVSNNTFRPQPGDQIFFRDYSHTGIVEKITGNVITTIEGNTSNQVARRTYAVGSRSIDGYGRPKFAVENSVESVETHEPGDVVMFTGSRHYISANTGTGHSCKPGKAKITNVKPEARHPYHLIKIAGGGSTVYGWVDAEDVAELDPVQSDSDAAFLPELRNGSAGDWVKLLQLRLISCGCSCGSSGIDGKFGTATENAVMMFRDKNGLSASGVCDTATWEKLLGV